MADLDLIRDFVNTAELEEARDDLEQWLEDNHGRPADAVQARAVREALRELLRSNNGVATELAPPSETLDAAARREGLRVGFHDGSIRLMARAGDEIDAPSGTFIYIRDPEAERVGFAREDGTVVMSLGGWAGKAFTPSDWETESLGPASS